MNKKTKQKSRSTTRIWRYVTQARNRYSDHGRVGKVEGLPQGILKVKGGNFSALLGWRVAVCSFDVTANLPRVGKVVALQSSRGARGPTRSHFLCERGRKGSVCLLVIPWTASKCRQHGSGWNIQQRRRRQQQQAKVVCMSPKPDAVWSLHLSHKIFHSGKKERK